MADLVIRGIEMPKEGKKSLLPQAVAFGLTHGLHGHICVRRTFTPSPYRKGMGG